MARAIPLLRGPGTVKAVIAGGGVAGAAVACLLGRDALLVEREAAAHDKICGEFLSWEAQAYLRRLGLDLHGLGASPIHSIRLVHGRQVAAARLPFSTSTATSNCTGF